MNYKLINNYLNDFLNPDNNLAISSINTSTLNLSSVEIYPKSSAISN